MLFEKREQFNFQFKRVNFYVWYMYVTYFILSNLKKKTCFLPSLLEKYLFRNRSLIYKFLRPLSLKVSVLFVVKCDFFLHFSSKRHQPMLWSLYTFKYTSACETFGKKKKKNHWLHRANTLPEYIKKYISIASLY